MKKENIPPFYLLYTRYKVKAKRLLNNPRKIKDNVVRSAHTVKDRTKKASVKTFLEKMLDASIEHTVFYLFYMLLGATFLGFVVYEGIVDGYSYILLVPAFISLFFFIVGMCIAVDAFAHWLVKVKRIDLTRGELRDRIKRRRITEDNQA